MKQRLFECRVCETTSHRLLVMSACSGGEGFSYTGFGFTKLAYAAKRLTLQRAFDPDQ